MKKIEVAPIDNPIEFKEINPEDFTEYNVYENRKIKIEPTKEGYISEQLIDEIDLELNNTVVVNAGVGQGKSYATIQLILKLLKEKDSDDKHKYTIVITAPYKSLIEQYKEKLIGSGVDESSIFDYRDFDNKEKPVMTYRVIHKPIHIITIQSLIGNFGDLALQQSYHKRIYIKFLISHCTNLGKKAVLFLDEIHDSISSFKERFILNLWNWEKAIHKIFALSATFNEASKVVIEYLAELTNDNLKLIECKRERIEEKQSDLHLCFVNRYEYGANDLQISQLIKQEADKGRKIDILSYSKKLAEEIVGDDKNPKSKIREILDEKFNKINLCTGDTSNPYCLLPSTCNVGTNFKTGVSIEVENSSYFLIMPSFKAYQGFTKKFGIYSDGINSIIQALARPRKKASIFVVLPSPKSIIKPNPNVEGYYPSLKDIYRLNKIEDKTNYHSFRDQEQIISDFYDKIKSHSETGQINLSKRYPNQSRSISRPPLSFPHKKSYILKDGGKVLMQYAIFGGDVSAYMVWASFNNQFLNCQLKSIYDGEPIFFNKGKVQQKLDQFYYEQFSGINYPIAIKSDLEFYKEFKFSLFTNKVIYEGKEILEYSNTGFERQIIAFIQRLRKNNDKYYNLMYPDGAWNKNEDSSVNMAQPFNKPSDFDIGKDYILSCISHSKREDIPENIDDFQKELISNYNAFFDLQNYFIDRFLFVDLNGRQFFLKDSLFSETALLSLEKLTEICRLIKSIYSLDKLIGNNVVSFMQQIGKINIESLQTNLDLQKKARKTIYSELKKFFFGLKRGKVKTEDSIDNSQQNILVELNKLPNHNDIINLLFIPEAAWIEYQDTILI